MSFQDIIEEQLQIVKERDEIITLDELHMICEAQHYRPPGEKWYSKHRSLVGAGAKVGAAVATVFTLGLYGIYRQMTDKCSQRCDGMTVQNAIKCNSICNMNASKHVLSVMNSRKGKLKDIKDPKKREKALKQFNKEYEKWQDRYEKYKDRIQASSSMITQMQAKKKKGK